jgi:polyphosphate kinase
MNSLVDRQIIEALYLASQAGVKIDLIVRGICCLRPRIRGLSENITVRSIVDRFLEHPRLFYFENACQPEVFIGSADWMPRNFFRRIEIVFPIEDGVLRERVKTELLDIPLADNLKARLLRSDGSYYRPALRPGIRARRSQKEFMELVAGGSTPTRATRTANPRAPRVKLRRRPTTTP